MPVRQRRQLRIEWSKEGKPAQSSSVLRTCHKVNQFYPQIFKWSQNIEILNHFPPVKKQRLTLSEKSTCWSLGSALWGQNRPPSSLSRHPSEGQTGFLLVGHHGSGPHWGSCVQKRHCIWGLQRWSKELFYFFLTFYFIESKNKSWLTMLC